MSNKNDVIAGVAMNNLHKMWPSQFDTEIPEPPKGWSWTVMWNEGHFEMILARPGNGDVCDPATIEVITRNLVIQMASVMRSNSGCLEVQ